MTFLPKIKDLAKLRNHPIDFQGGYAAEIQNA